VLRSHPSGNETEPLGLGKGSRSEPGAELRLKIQLAVENRSTGFEAAGPQPDYRHQMSKCDLARDETCSHAGDLTSKETRSNRDPCWDRSWLSFATDSDCTHIPFPTSLRKAAAQGEERYWAVQPTAAGGTFPGPTGPAPRVRAPRIPRKRLRPGLSELEPAGAQYAPDTVFRAPCTARVFLGITGPGPGETDSDVSLRQNPAARWTRMEDPHVRAGEVVIRKTPGHGTIRRARFIKGRPEQFVAPLS
jgi:hypothetical protein